MPTTTEIDLTPFCGHDGNIYDLHTPFVQDGWKVATDGRILIRVRTNEFDTAGRKVPDVKRPPYLLTTPAKWQLLSNAKLVEKTVLCEHCGVQSQKPWYYHMGLYLGNPVYIDRVRNLPRPRFFCDSETETIWLSGKGWCGALKPFCVLTA